MFNRVAGGNFTKSADISSDYLDKLRHDLPEDDPRIPNVLADFIGDMVNDIAGNCSDLLESYVATLVASQLIANIVYGMNGNASPEVYAAMSLFPIVVATIGLFGCTIGIIVAILRKNSMSDNPAGELNKVTYISASVSLIGSLVAAYVMFGNKALYASFKAGWLSPFIAAFFGIASGVIIGKVTEIYTSTDYGFVKKLAEVCPDGAAFLITLGDALGFRSCLIPGITISISIILSYVSCGFYGIAIASLGMLSFVGATVSIDAFGPIADNAGGNAQMSELDPSVREKTDILDSLGNTTAATGKGFAIGSAALTALALLASYIEEIKIGLGHIGKTTIEVGGQTIETVRATITDIVNFYDISLMNPLVLVGIFIGAMMAFLFCGLTMNAVGRAAEKMVIEVRRQFREIAGILEGKQRPDYTSCVRISTKAAQHEMIFPSLLAIIVPMLVGAILGPAGVIGLLAGGLGAGFVLAIFLANSGGAWDNAKKYVEEGHFGGKGSVNHHATVVGDTVGDPFKDTSGPSLNILIKLMSMVSIVMAGLTVMLH